MKKLFLFAAAASAIIIAATSCDKKPQPEPEKEITISVNPSSVTVKGEGETVKLAIETNAESVQCAPGADWLQATVNGKELVLTAATNPNEEARSTQVTLKAGTKEVKVNVTQSEGSKYPGYSRAVTEGATYSGYLYQKFYDVEDGDGGNIILNLSSPDGRYTLHLEMFTTLFESEDDVELTTGTYTKGNDDPNGVGFVCKAMTWMPGTIMVISDEEGDEELSFGSWLHTTIGENTTSAKVTSGSISVEKTSDGYSIKTDLVAEDGSPIKYYYEGPIDIDSDGAIYPGEGSLPEITSFTSATIGYMGDSGEDATKLQMTLYCNEEGMPNVNYTFYVPRVSFSDLASTDLSGSYYQADGEELIEGAPGTVEIGSSLDFGGFIFPTGSYVVTGMMEFFIPDGMVSLILAKGEDGKYNVTGVMADAEFSAFYMFMDTESYIEVEFYDGTEEYEED